MSKRKRKSNQPADSSPPGQAGPEKKGKGVGWIQNLLLVTVGLAVGFLMAEGIARYLTAQGPPTERQRRFFHSEPVPDSDQVYRILPNREFVTFGIAYKTNEFGFRDQPLEAKTENVFRILCVGDSVTFGTGVEIEETFPNVLEKDLAAKAPVGKKYDVVNAGVSAYNARNIRAQLESLIDVLRPDLVVYTFVENDLDDSFSVGPDQFLYQLDPRSGPDDPFYSDDFAPTWFLQRLAKREFKSALAKLVATQFHTLSGEAPPLLIGDHPTPRQRWSEFEDDLRKMRDLCTDRNAGFALFEFGLQNNSEPVSRKLREVASDLGVVHASTLPVFSIENYESEYSLGFDPHCNPLGNRMMAQTLHRFLSREGLIPDEVRLSEVDPEPPLDETVADRLEESRRTSPTLIEPETGKGMQAVLGGIDYRGRMARSCKFRLGGVGDRMVVTARSAVSAPGESHLLSARIEDGSPAEYQRVSPNGSELVFEIPDPLRNLPIEVELRVKGPVWIPEPRERLVGEAPATLGLGRIARE